LISHTSLAELKLERLRYLQSLRSQLYDIERNETEGIKLPWSKAARPEQLPPPGDWRVWLILAGRGWGKTRSAAEWSVDKARQYPGCRIALVARTIGDARDTMCEGDSGLIACLHQEDFRGGSEDKGYNRSLGEIYLSNGSKFKTFTSEKPWRLRGPQFHLAWADEACFWADAHKGTIADTTWSNLNIATRLKPRLDWSDSFRPQIVIATTPRPVALLRSSDPDSSRLGLMQRESTIVTRGRTADNLSNLSDTYYENVVVPLLGTRLGRQELDAELLDDVPGALWKREWLDDHRVSDPSLVPDLIRVVVGVDPAVTDGESSAQTGIVVAGAARNGRGYVLGDFTLRASPMEAIKKAISVFHEFNADRIVAETNNGGDYIGTLVKTIDPNVPFMSVRATRGKAIRAEPISSLYEQGRISHVGTFPRLEDEMCSWTPLDPVSPDMVDALVWAITALKDLIGGSFLSAYGVTRCEACGAAFLTAENGRPRTACPSCRAPVVRLVAVA
jgi:phage terminase large subunit-like protein